jgi:hypothetical protein
VPKMIGDYHEIFLERLCNGRRDTVGGTYVMHNRFEKFIETF